MSDTLTFAVLAAAVEKTPTPAGVMAVAAVLGGVFLIALFIFMKREIEKRRGSDSSGGDAA